jgi:hypothetical protein
MSSIDPSKTENVCALIDGLSKIANLSIIVR